VLYKFIIDIIYVTGTHTCKRGRPNKNKHQNNNNNKTSSDMGSVRGPKATKTHEIVECGKAEEVDFEL